LAPGYDIVLDVLGLGRSFKAAVAKLAQGELGEAVLDLGCGTGHEETFAADLTDWADRCTTATGVPSLPTGRASPQSFQSSG
jgi:ubiquinone/menaquinone biosynthesis C-methylase UbiE